MYGYHHNSYSLPHFFIPIQLVIFYFMAMYHSNMKELPSPPPGKAGWPWAEEMPHLTETKPDSSPWPRISIVTPSYNQAQFIEETIRSVLLQGYPNLEYIIIDGGSIDGSVEIIKKYEPWLTYWVSEPDQGQTYAIDKGIRRARGEILNWLNSDDYLLPGALFALADAYKNNGHKGCVLCGNACYVNESGEILKETPVKAVNPDDADIPWPSRSSLDGGIQASTFFSVEAWDRVKGLNLELNYTMDTDLYWRSQEAGIHFIPVDHKIAAYRTHRNTKTRRGWQESISYKKRFYQRQFEKFGKKEQSLYRKRLQIMFFRLYLRGITSDDHFLTRLLRIALAIRESPLNLLSKYQLGKCLWLLFSPPDEVRY